MILDDIVKKSIDRIKSDMKIGFPISFGYKDIESYYGKCYFYKRHITLQTSLAKYNIKYILSVIYHECAHFYYHDHQEGFYSLLEGVFPGYKRTQHELRMTKYREFF